MTCGERRMDSPTAFRPCVNLLIALLVSQSDDGQKNQSLSQPAKQFPLATSHF
eukprot:m.96695 g.96695  ORF g.96695 m.96695 type:complete len:53 (-) comp13081_c0_seq1:7-165(-)